MDKNFIKIEVPGAKLYPELRATMFSLSDISSLSLLSTTQDVNTVCEVLNKNLDFDVKKLTMQDAWFLMYWHRINSISSYPHKLPWMCPHCNTKNLDTLTASKLVITDLDEEYQHGLELPLESGTYPLRLPLFGDELTSKNFIKREHLSNTIDTLNEVMLAQMLSPNGLPLLDNYNTIKSMSSNDYLDLKAFKEEFDYGVQNYIETFCENTECASHEHDDDGNIVTKGVATVSFNFDLASFFPEVSARQSVRSRILSRSASKPTSDTPKADGLRGSDLFVEEAPENSQRRREPDQEHAEQPEMISMTQEQLQEYIKQEAQKSVLEENIDLEAITKGR